MSNLINITNASLTISALEQHGMLCSRTPESKEDKALIFNALTGGATPMKEMVNKEIALVDVIVQPYNKEDPETGEVTTGASITFIDEAGQCYGTNSIGIFESLKALVLLYGEPTWHEPVIVTVNSKKIGRGDMLFLTMK